MMPIVLNALPISDIAFVLEVLLVSCKFCIPSALNQEGPTYHASASSSSGSVSIIVLATNLPKPGFLFSILKKSSLCATTVKSVECIRNLPSSANF